MRLFVGLRLDEATRALCMEAQHLLLRAAIDARCTAPENLHLTLAFLGEVPPERCGEIVSVIDEVAGTQSPFSLPFDRIGAFPNERRPRIVYLGARDAGARFRYLSDAVRAHFSRLGFTFDDDAVAHVTLARIRGGSVRPLPQIEIASHTMPAREVALFESLRRERELRYEVLHASVLAG